MTMTSDSALLRLHLEAAESRIAVLTADLAAARAETARVLEVAGYAGEQLAAGYVQQSKRISGLNHLVSDLSTEAEANHLGRIEEITRLVIAEHRVEELEKSARAQLARVPTAPDCARCLGALEVDERGMGLGGKE